MADYYGTDEDDVIDASLLPEDFNKAGDKIYPGKGNDEIINIDGHEVVSSEGNDTYSGKNIKLGFTSDPKSIDINLREGSVTDTEGSNTIQLPINTYIDKSLFTKNAARLTLEDGREITISGADKFSYNVGGNVTDGTKGTDLTFSEFAEVFGVYDILNSSGAQTGEISDMYII